jgi:hypothetical protein
MNMSDTSAMTEASGLVEEQDGESRSDFGMGPDQRLLKISDWMRSITLAAPLSSLFVAFLLGIIVARRR